MEYIVEFILEFVFEGILEGSMEASTNRRIPKYIRYPLIGILSLFFIAVIGLVFFGGILALKENILVGMFLILVGLFLLIMSIVKFRKAYLIKKDKI